MLLTAFVVVCFNYCYCYYYDHFRLIKNVQLVDKPLVVAVVVPLELETTFCNFTRTIRQVCKWDLPLCWLLL
jgi:hypothetical protein